MYTNGFKRPFSHTWRFEADPSVASPDRLEETTGPCHQIWRPTVGAIRVVAFVPGVERRILPNNNSARRVQCVPSINQRWRHAQGETSGSSRAREGVDSLSWQIQSHRLDSVAYCEDVVTDTEVVRCLLLLAMVAVKNRVDTPRHRRSGRVLQKRFSCVSTFPMSVPSLSR